MKERIPEFFLEQYRLGEATADVVHLIEADEDALLRLQEMDADSEEILQRYPPGWFADRVEDRAYRLYEKENPRQGTQPTGTSFVEVVKRAVRTPVFVPAVALVVLGALFIPQVLQETSVNETLGTPESLNEMARGERTKGLDTDISLYRNGNSGVVEELLDGNVAATGDTLQIAYRAAGASYGMIFSVDGRGVVTLHYPESPVASAALNPEGETALPYAYVLDDAPAYEQFFFVAAPDEFDIPGVLRTVAEAVETARKETNEEVLPPDAIQTVVVDSTPSDATVRELTVYKTGEDDNGSN